jgi:putative ABC transport system ATP-binding protein
MIEIKNLSYQIGGAAILDALSWKVETGQHALMLGASGSGKTTLLHLLAGLLTPSSGTIEIDGQNIAGLSGAALDSWRGRNIGMVFQTLHLVKALTVQYNLRLASSMAGLPEDDARITYLLDKLGLSDKAKSYPHQLSVGQAQRVAIARAVVNKPKWILADEPTSALDDAHCEETLNLLEAQAQECGATLVIATHDQRIKTRFSHRIELQNKVRQAA